QPRRPVLVGDEIAAAEQQRRNLARREAALQNLHAAHARTSTSGKPSIARGVSCCESISRARRSSSSASRYSISERLVFSVTGMQNSAASLAISAWSTNGGTAASAGRKT